MDREALKNKHASQLTTCQTHCSASHAIHAKPELAFEEHFAHGLLTDRVEEAGLPVERGACDLDTAFISSFGDTGVEVGILSEYDSARYRTCVRTQYHACSGLGAALAKLGAALPGVCAIWAHRRKPAAAKRLWRNMVLLTGSMRQ